MIGARCSTIGSASKLHVLALAVDDEKSIDAFAADVKKIANKVDVLYNNAGISSAKSGLQLTLAESQQVLLSNTVRERERARAILCHAFPSGRAHL